MTDHLAMRLLRMGNLGVAVAAYYGMLTLHSSSTQYRIALVGGALVVALVAAATLSAGIRNRWRGWLTRFGNGPIRSTAAIAPWLGLVGVIASNGLWWTQRPVGLRAFVAYTLLNWSGLWTLAPPSRRLSTQTHAVTFWLAAALTAIGLEGLVFGVTPFGCGLSALIAAAGAVALSVARFGSTSACLKVFAVSVATVLGVGILEISVRVARLGQTVQEVDSREYAREFYSLTPPRAAFVNNPSALDEFPPALIEINSLGIRGPEIPDRRADVLLIGDSMIEARQLAWEQTLGPRLRDAFASRSVPIRVVSHGMRGWSPLLEWNWYLKVGRTLKPDIVMLSFFWNDLWTSGDEVSTFRAVLDAKGRPQYFDVPVDASWIWYKHVRVVRLAADVWRRLSISQIKGAFSELATSGAPGTAIDTATAQARARKLVERPLNDDELRSLLLEPLEALSPDLRQVASHSFWPSIRPLRLWSESQRAAAARTELTLQRFAEDVAADGGRLVIVFVPNPLQLSPRECSVGRLFERVDTNVVLPPESGIQTWIREVAERHRIELLDPSAAMRQQIAGEPADADPLYLRADCHWSARGQQFMADYLFEWFERNEASAR